MNSRLVRVLFFATVLLPRELPACDCVERTEEYFDVILEGKVVSGTESKGKWSDSARRYQIDVHRVWRGSLGSTVIIESSMSNCGAVFEVGHIYEIRAKYFAGTLVTGACFGGREIQNRKRMDEENDA